MTDEKWNKFIDSAREIFQELEDTNLEFKAQYEEFQQSLTDKVAKYMSQGISEVEAYKKALKE